MAARELRLSRILASLVVVVIILALLALNDAVSPVLVFGVVAFGLVATIPRAGIITLQSLCAAVVALLALIGFNIAVGQAIKLLPDGLVSPDARLPIQAGLLVAVVVFWASAYFYLRAAWLDAIRSARAWVAPHPGCVTPRSGRRPGRYSPPACWPRC